LPPEVPILSPVLMFIKSMMNCQPNGLVPRVAQFADRRLLLLLLLAYVAATFFPSLGQTIRTTTVTPVPLPVLLLAVLLFIAGLGMDRGQLRESLRWKSLMVAGQIALWGGPLIVVLLLGQLNIFPHGLLTGLALVALMPTAASSVAWSQLSRGNVALSVGLLAASTLLSPFVIYAVGRSGLLAAGGEFSSSANATIIGLISWIIPAVVAGACVRCWAGRGWINAIRPHIKLVSTAVLLLLNYSNAAVALPEMFANPNWTNLASVATTTVVMCSGGFLVGWLLTRAGNVEPSVVRSFLFGMGMKNTGMALVLAGMWFASQPLAIVTVIFYTLAQHLIAAACHGRAGRHTR
jgi:BASS family bile acid:Na+ symporter